MKILEMRRCSLRASPGKGLSDVGTELAARARAYMARAYDAYAASPKRRAGETLWALGFPVYMADAVFAPPDAGVKALFAGTATDEAPLKKQFAKFLTAVQLMTEPIHEGGRVLVVSHLPTMMALIRASGQSVAGWSADDCLRPLEGLQIEMEANQIRGMSVLRLPDALYESLDPATGAV
jgi:hypothetical protein